MTAIHSGEQQNPTHSRGPSSPPPVELLYDFYHLSPSPTYIWSSSINLASCFPPIFLSLCYLYLIQYSAIFTDFPAKCSNTSFNASPFSLPSPSHSPCPISAFLLFSHTFQLFFHDTLSALFVQFISTLHGLVEAIPHTSPPPEIPICCPVWYLLLLFNCVTVFVECFFHSAHGTA